MIYNYDLVIRAHLGTWDNKNVEFNEELNNRYMRGAFKLAERVENAIKERLSETNGKVYQCVYVLDCHKISDHIKTIGLRNVYTGDFIFLRYTFK